jgi:rare lipoprotein A (peptidoglycan hydrolase)
MTYLIFNTIDAFNAMEKQYCYNGIAFTAAARFGGDGKYKNVTTGEKKYPHEIDYETFNTEDYPLFYRKNGILQTKDGYTTAMHSAHKAIDGKWYAIKREDIHIAKYGITIPYGSSFYNNCTWDGETSEKPEFPDTEE